MLCFLFWVVFACRVVVGGELNLFIVIYTIDWEIFALKIIRPLNFRVKHILSFNGSAT